MKHLYLTFILLIFSSCNIVKLVTGNDTKLDDNFLRRDLYIKLYISPEFERRSYFLDTENANVIFFDYGGANAAECSKDDGTSWFDCRDGKIVFAQTDFFNIFRVKISNSEKVIEEIFMPGDFFPNGMSTLTCDETVIANETLAIFSNRLGSNKVICIDDGVQIGSPAENLSLTLNSNDIIFAKPNRGVSILASMSPLISSNGGTNIVISGINFFVNPGQTIFYNTASDIVVESSRFDLNTSNGIAIDVSGSNTNLFKFNNLEIFGSGTGIKVTDTNSDISFVNIHTDNSAVEVNRDSAEIISIYIDDSFIETTAAAPAVGSPGTIKTQASNGAGETILSIQDSIINSKNGSPAIVDISTALSTYTLQIFNSVLKRGSELTVSSAAVLLTNDSVNDEVFFDYLSLICNESSSTNANFDKIILKNNMAATSNEADMDAHTANVDIGLCSNFSF